MNSLNNIFVSLIETCLNRLDPLQESATLLEAAALDDGAVYVVYSQPMHENILGLRIDINEFRSSFDPVPSDDELAQDIVQSHLIEPSHPGRVIKGTPYAEFSMRYGEVLWNGDIQKWI